MRFWPLLLPSYALAAHLGVTYGQPLPAAVLLAALLAVSFLRMLRAHDFGGALLIGVYALATLAMLGFIGIYGMLFLPPVAANLAVALFFGRTLLPGSIPLVTRIALSLHPERSPRVLRYTRHVTWAWMWFCLGMAALSAVLAASAPLKIWSFFSNFLDYLLLGGFFLCEVALRRVMLQGEPAAGLRETLQAMGRMDLRRILQA